MNTYSIAHLVASAYLGSKGMGKLGSAFVCDEGTASPTGGAGPSASGR